MGDNLNGIFANMIQGMGFIGCAPNRVYNMAPPDGGGVEATAEGTELTLHSAAAPLTALTLYGKSEQRTTTGAQLFDANQIVDGFVNGANVGESFAVSAHPSYTNAQYVEVKTTDINIIAWNLTGCVKTGAGDSGIRIRYFDAEGVSVKEGGIVLETGYSETQNADSVYVLAIYGFTEEAKSKAIVNTGITALPWEPYTGGKPSPSPDYPQEIKSVGDSGTINVSLSDGGSQSQTLPVQTPNGLPGIPVSSGGNYTDANGQRWICDEVDFKRRVYVQRIIRYTGPFYKMYWAQTDSWFVIASSLANIPKPSYRGFCNISDYYKGSWDNLGHSHWFLQTGGQQIVIHLGDTYNTEEAVEQFIEKNGIVVYYAAETSIETPLSTSELAAYSALRTYSPTTVVSNDAGAWMNVGYKATPQPMTMLARKR